MQVLSFIKVHLKMGFQNRTILCRSQWNKDVFHSIVNNSKKTIYSVVQCGTVMSCYNMVSLHEYTSSWSPTGHLLGQRISLCEFKIWFYTSWPEEIFYRHHFQFDGLVQERRNSSALAMESRLFCTNQSIFNIPMLCLRVWLTISQHRCSY